MSSKRRKRVVHRVLRWFDAHARRLPWRFEKDPFRVLVSEVMLQQTQVSRVLVMYSRFLSRFPTFEALASARQSEVVRAWQGMGYNNRAVRLHRLAKLVVHQNRGKLPGTLEDLLTLPGVGRYTAHALLSSVFGKRVPQVDVNVQRFFSRIFRKMKSTAELVDQSEIWNVATVMLPRRRTYEWNQALMDIGATICTARQPLCGVCPVSDICASRPSMRKGITRPTRPEPLVEGIPNRMYRGRVIEQLRRSTSQRGVSLDRLGMGIRPTFTSREREWLRSIIESLEKDGLVKVTGNGSWRSRRATLA